MDWTGIAAAVAGVWGIVERVRGAKKKRQLEEARRQRDEALRTATELQNILDEAHRLGREP